MSNTSGYRIPLRLPNGGRFMPDSTAASNSRFYRRLAEGVQRTRLVEPILIGRPPLVVIGAPSGYGKTVLAAQIAASRPTEEVVWIDCGGGGSLDDDLTRLTGLLSSQTPDQCLGSASDNCSRTLSEIPDGRSLLLVFDDAGWAADAASLALLGSTLVEAPSARSRSSPRAQSGVSRLPRCRSGSWE